MENKNIKINKKYLNLGQIVAQIASAVVGILATMRIIKIASISDQISSWDEVYNLIESTKSLAKNFSSLNFYNIIAIVILCVSLFLVKDSFKKHIFSICSVLATRLSLIAFSPIINIMKVVRSLGKNSDIFEIESKLSGLESNVKQVSETRGGFGLIILVVGIVFAILAVIKGFRLLRAENNGKIFKDEEIANMKKAAKNSGDFAMYTLAKGKEKIGQGLEKAGEKLDDFKEEYEAKKKEEKSSKPSENSESENNEENTSEIIEEVADKSSDANEIE